MPELPEVETVKRQLAGAVKGRTIKKVEIRHGKNIKPINFSSQIRGKKILGFERRAKNIIVKLSGDLWIIVHLKMTGKFLVKEKNAEPDKHTHAIFYLTGKNDLHWNDVRKFGYLQLMKKSEAEKWLEEKYGPEPLSDDFSWKLFADCLRRHPKSKIKPLLMSQGCIAGIGNIYATEALWQAKIHPLTIVGKIDDEGMKRLHDATRSTMKKALEYGGTSSDSYTDAFGEKGRFVYQLKAYGREGLPCPRDKTKMQKLKVGGRGTVICPRCQRRK